jgi:hypothetical protein
VGARGDGDLRAMEMAHSEQQIATTFFLGEATPEAVGHHDFLGDQNGGVYRWPPHFFMMREGAFLETA